MPYVPPELKERIKREISVQRLAEVRGIKLRRSGKELIGLCPFHKDTNPSLNIDPVKNVWHCKGACGKAASHPGVMLAEGISFAMPGVAVPGLFSFRCAPRNRRRENPRRETAAAHRAYGQ